MNDEYITKELGEVAALVTEGCDLQAILWKDDTAYFRFRDSDAIQSLQQQYYFGDLHVTARAFYDNLRMIKRRLYTQQPGPKHRGDRREA